MAIDADAIADGTAVAATTLVACTSHHDTNPP